MCSCLYVGIDTGVGGVGWGLCKENGCLPWLGLGTLLAGTVFSFGAGAFANSWLAQMTSLPACLPACSNFSDLNLLISLCVRIFINCFLALTGASKAVYKCQCYNK